MSVSSVIKNCTLETIFIMRKHWGILSSLFISQSSLALIELFSSPNYQKSIFILAIFRVFISFAIWPFLIVIENENMTSTVSDALKRYRDFFKQKFKTGIYVAYIYLIKIIVFTSMLLIPGFYLATLFIFVSQSFVLEDKKVNAFEVSRGFIEPYLWKVIGIILLYLIVSIPMTIFFTTKYKWVLSIGSVFIGLVSPILMTIIYFQFRKKLFHNISEHRLYMSYPSWKEALLYFIVYASVIVSIYFLIQGMN